MGLYDMLMIKDNHIAAAGGITAAVSRARAYLKQRGLSLPIEVEAQNLDDVREALAGVEKQGSDGLGPPVRQCTLRSIVFPMRFAFGIERSPPASVAVTALCQRSRLPLGARTQRQRKTDKNVSFSPCGPIAAVRLVRPGDANHAGQHVSRGHDRRRRPRRRPRGDGGLRERHLGKHRVRPKTMSRSVPALRANRPAYIAGRLCGARWRPYA